MREKARKKARKKATRNKRRNSITKARKLAWKKVRKK